MQKELQLAPQITDPKIHVPFGGPAVTSVVIKVSHEQKRPQIMGGWEGCK